jgi:hypothetical protein
VEALHEKLGIYSGLYKACDDMFLRIKPIFEKQVMDNRVKARACI